jgi:Protein of unknown function (DUF2948)
MSERSGLRLLAEDTDDLAVISAALQDAVTRVGDIEFDARGRRLTIGFNRFRRESGKRERVRSGLQVGGVLALQARRIRRDRKDAVMSLLSIGFEPSEAPAGVLTLTFAGGGDLRAEVECVDAMLADVSDPWPTPRAPDHDG